MKNLSNLSKITDQKSDEYSACTNIAVALSDDFFSHAVFMNDKASSMEECCSQIVFNSFSSTASSTPSVHIKK